MKRSPKSYSFGYFFLKLLTMLFITFVVNRTVCAQQNIRSRRQKKYRRLNQWTDIKR